MILRNRANIFIEHSLKTVLDFFKEAVCSEEIARSRGVLQSIDPRIKILLLIAFLIITLYARSIHSLLGLYIFSVLLAVLSGIKVIFFIKRVWFFIPVFTLFIAIPAVFTQGLSSAAIFVLRVTACVSFVVEITITTKHNHLIKSLKALGVPPIFIQVLDMTYRYIFLYIKAFEDMHMSLKGRLVKKLGQRDARRWVASRISTLFKKSIKMSEEVYMAMLARGYAIEVKKDAR